MADDAPPGGRDYWILFALWLMVLASSSQVLIVAPILPHIARELGVGGTLQGALVTGYAVALSVGAIIIGPISDRVGRRRVLLWGTGAIFIALVFHVLAYRYEVLLAVRTLAGLGGGMLTGAAVSFVGDYFPYSRRGWANGWVMSGFAVGQIVAIPAGTLLAGAYGFRAPFLLFAALMGLSFLLILLVVPQPDVDRETAPLGFRQATRDYLRLLGRRDVLAATVAYGMIFLNFSTFVVFFPTWTETTLKVGSSETAILFLVGGVASAFVSPTAGRLSDRLGRKPIIVGACLGTAALMLLTTTIVVALWLAYVVFFLAMMLYAARLSPFQALLTSLVDARQRGTLLCLVVAGGQLGGGIGGVLAGWLYASSGYFADTVLAAAAIATTAALVAWGLPERATPSPAP